MIKIKSILSILFLINGIALYGQYVSKGSGSFTNPAIWTLPWVGAPLPPGNGQQVIISAGDTITGSLPNCDVLDVKGTVIYLGNYTNGCGGLTIEDGGTMIITGNLNTSDGLTIKGNGKLKVLGNLNESGGSITISNSGILVVGQTFTENWQITTVNNYGTILIIQNYYVQGDLTVSGTSEVAVLGTVSGGGCPSCTNSISSTDPAWIFWLYGIPNSWLGATDTNWNNSANWAYLCIPVNGENVRFGSTAQRDLVLDQNRTIGDLTNVSTKNLIIPAGKTLKVNGTVTTNNANRIQIQAASNTTNGSFIFKNPPATAVQATVQMYTKGFYGSQWTWTDPKGKIFQGYYRWQFFGIPVQSVATASPTFDGSWVREYHESLNMDEYYNKWTQLNNSSSLVAFNGYEITQATPTFIIFQGALVTGDRTLTLTKTTSGTLNYGSGYNIFGNSYTAAIDIAKMSFGSGVQQTVYLYNTGSLADWSANGALQNSSAGSYYAIPYQTTSVLGKEIPSMQGFMLIATTNGATVTIPYNNTTSSATANTTQQRVKQAAPVSADLSYMTVDVTGQNGGDRVWLFSQPGTTHGFDNGWDGEKIIASNGVTLYAAEEAGNYQVNTVDDINDTYLGFQPGQDTVYTLTFAQHNTENIYSSLYLVDLVENKVTDITADASSYTFKTTSTTAPVKRFKIITLPISIKNDLVDAKVKIFSSGSNIFVQNLSSMDGECILYDMAGHYIKKVIFGANEVTTVSTNINPGVYVAKALTNGEEITKRLIVW